MANPYHFPTARTQKPPALSLLTLIGVAFAAFMVWQISTTIADSQDEVGKLAIHAGDEIEYDYTARLPNGAVYETTIEEVARRANATHNFPLQPAFTYIPQRAVMNPDVPGLAWPEGDAAVVGAHVGQTVRFTSSAGVGTWEPFTPGGAGIPRALLPQFFQREVFLQETGAAAEEGNVGSPNFNYQTLDSQLGPLYDGFVYNAGRTFPPSWDIVMDDVNPDNKSILFHHAITSGQYFDVPNLPGGVTVLIEDNESRLVYRLDLQPGGLFSVAANSELNQAGFTPGSYRVASVNDETVNLDYHPGPDPSVVGLPLDIEVHIRNKVAAGAPPVTPTNVGTAGGDGHDDHTH